MRKKRENVIKIEVEYKPEKKKEMVFKLEYTPEKKGTRFCEVSGEIDCKCCKA